MKRSTDKILCSHGGNLPRPQEFDAKLSRFDDHKDEIALELPRAIEWVVDKQIECRVDIINDGEYVKAANGGSYGSYMATRATGLDYVEHDPNVPAKRAGTAERDKRDFPGFFASGLWFAGSGGPVRPGFVQPPRPGDTGTLSRALRDPICNGPLSYTGHDEVQKDVDALNVALMGKESAGGFIATLGPLSFAARARNLHYSDEREYLFAAAEVMREEYKAITDAGLIMQMDEPEFATTWMFYPDWSHEQYRNHLDFMVEVINHALEGIPEEQVRFHFCWGSGHRPHTNDVEFKYLADKMIKINAQCYTFEASNPRHAHEYKVFEDVKLPDGKIIAPGVVGHYTDLVEHPELVAERLVNYAKLVGMENLHACTDCGIGSRVGHEEIVWAKLKAMSEGCQIASKRIKAGL